MKTNNIYFIRWGNLNPVKHKEARKADEQSWIHIAPCYKGVYAFPRGYVELCIVGGEFGAHNTRLLKDEDGNPIPRDMFYTEHYDIQPKYRKIVRSRRIRQRDLIYIEKKGIQYVGYNLKPKLFDYKGDIWHHLVKHVKKSDIIDAKHGWVKTTFHAYFEALRQSSAIDRFNSALVDNNKYDADHVPFYNYFNDMYEVFIEHIK